MYPPKDFPNKKYCLKAEKIVSGIYLFIQRLIMLKRLIEKKDKECNVVAFMSGSGTNLVKIIEHMQDFFDKNGYVLYSIKGILTDNPTSNASTIGDKYGIPVEINDISHFYKSKNLKRSDLSVRAEFDTISLKKIEKFKPDLIVLAGYMSVLSRVIINRYLTINIHPADLSILDQFGKRKYTGAHAVRDAILAGEKFIYSTTHIVEEEVDNGKILIISKPVEVILPKNFNPEDKNMLISTEKENQNRLKENGDWQIFPLTLDYISLGYFEIDEKNNLYFKGNPIPKGLRL